jgi:hypothetical protein
VRDTNEKARATACAAGLSVAFFVAGASGATLPARETADILRPGHWSVGVLDPLRIGATDRIEIVTHPIITLLLSPNLQARVALRKSGLRVTGEYGVSVPTVAMRLTSGYLFPSWERSENRVGWFVVPSVGLALSYGERTVWTGRIDSAIGIPVGRNDATPLDTWAPIELIFAPALNGYRHHLGTSIDHALTDWLRVRGALDAWMIGPFDPPKSQLIFAASARMEARLSERWRLSLGGIVYESDQRRQEVVRGDDGRWRREKVRSIDVYPTFDLVFTH